MPFTPLSSYASSVLAATSPAGCRLRFLGCNKKLLLSGVTFFSSSSSSKNNLFFSNIDDLVSLLLVVQLMQYKCIYFSNFSFGLKPFTYCCKPKTHLNPRFKKKKKGKRESGHHLQTSKRVDCNMANGHGSELGPFTVRQGGLDSTSAI